MKLRFFKTPADWRRWLEQNHESVEELWVGFYKRDSGKPSITWPESVDEALCFGWIDGLRRSVDVVSYCIRFTPRRAGSIWSAINISKIAELTKQQRMHPAGTRTFENRKVGRDGLYGYEQVQESRLPPPWALRFKANKAAWKYFSAQPPHYRRLATFWVVRAKREETRLRRLERLIADSAQGQWVGPMKVGRK